MTAQYHQGEFVFDAPIPKPRETAPQPASLDLSWNLPSLRSETLPSCPLSPAPLRTFECEDRVWVEGGELHGKVLRFWRYADQHGVLVGPAHDSTHAILKEEGGREHLLPLEALTKHSSPVKFWKSLKPKDRFSVPPRRFSGEHGPQVYIVREEGEDHSLVVVREGGRRRFVALLRDDDHVELKEEKSRFPRSFSITLGPPSPAPEASEITPLPSRPEKPHSLYEAAERNVTKLGERLSGISGPKAKRVLERHRAILARAAILREDEKVPRDLEHEYHQALNEARDYLHSRRLSETKGTRKEEEASRSRAERTDVKPDTPLSELPTPEPGEAVRAFPEALKLFEHVRARRLVDSVTISNYPIGRALGGFKAPRGHLHAAVEYDASRNAWRTVTQTTEAFGGNLCKPKRSIFHPWPTFVVEPQEEERGVFLHFSREAVFLQWVNGTVEREFRVPEKPWVEDDPDRVEKEKAHEQGLQALKELRTLCELRRVAVRIEADDLDAHLERNHALLEAVLERKGKQYVRLLEEVGRRLDQVRGVSDPNRLSSQGQKSYSAARRTLRDAGVDPDTGKRNGGGTLDRIERLFRRHGRDLPARDEAAFSIAAARKTGAERLAELERIQERKPTTQLTEAQRRLGQFMTPHPIAYRMAELGEVAGKTVLDPTCGEGRLLNYALELGAAKAIGVELDASLAAFATRSGAKVLRADLLDLDPMALRADVLLMNPPFTSGGPDTERIVEKALRDCWTREGKAVVILPAGPAGERLIGPYTDVIVYEETLPDEAFVREGTNVRTRLYVLDAQA